ncbi:MAG: hypothetical protein K6A38_05270 [Lachnospiraceae bacterium]|nr:hypothetical protein [Lachnospiraceae bacterium]
MLEFEEELKKFHPSLEVEELEEAVFSQEFTDIADALIQVLETSRKTGEKN